MTLRLILEVTLRVNHANNLEKSILGGELLWKGLKCYLIAHCGLLSNQLLNEYKE